MVVDLGDIVVIEFKHPYIIIPTRLRHLAAGEKFPPKLLEIVARKIRPLRNTIVMSVPVIVPGI